MVADDFEDTGLLILTDFFYSDGDSLFHSTGMAHGHLGGI